MKSVIMKNSASVKMAKSFHSNSQLESSKILKSFLADEVQKVKEWWAKPRFKNVQRPYTALDVVKHRGCVPADVTRYPSSFQSQKLFQLLEEKFEKKLPLHTLGVIDPVQMSQLARCKEIEVAYISGWACSSTLVGSTNEVSPDFGDYPYNTVPNQVERIFKSQQMHDKKLFLEKVNGATKDTTTNYLKPIIADADMGHGGSTTVMKLAKLFAEKGAAAIHLEDQLVGGKKCGHLGGIVIVPTSTHLSRLIATRFQWDMMGTENLLIARTDSCNAKLLSSSSDPRDHEFIKGVIEYNLKPWSDKLTELENQPGVTSSQIASAESEWFKTHQVFTFDEAVAKQVSEADYAKYRELRESALAEKPFLSLTDMKNLVQRAAPTKVVHFDWDAPRTKEGYYLYNGCLEAAVKRSLAFAPYADMIWLETKTPDIKQAKSFAAKIHEVYPHVKLVYNLSPSFNWSSHGYDAEDLRNFIWDLAKHGFVLQLVSLAGLHVDGLAFWQLAKAFGQKGMQAYVELVQRPEKIENSDVLTHQKWSGAEYVDSVVKVLQNGSSSQTLSTSGDAFTETQF
ncbi:ICL2 (YPR006C) [Zygosaccharomyces parabailii]|nr:ICL2 (YPR006C) [Zygosaccharomyces parabailii]CDH09704.1 probable Mitochondrial 2-methylisocitrate lyase [Zygosaccharomyces bailii ISA1307]